MFIKHIRNINGQPFATVAVGDSGIGFAICNEDDQFSKKIGRKIAISRANNPKFNINEFINRCPKRCVNSKNGYLPLRNIIEKEINHIKQIYMRN